MEEKNNTSEDALVKKEQDELEKELSELGIELEAPKLRSGSIVNEIHYINIAYLLLDISYSMEGEKLSYAKDGLLKFSKDAFKRKYKLGFITFGSSAEIILTPATNFQIIQNKLSSISAEGSTNLTDSIQLASNELSKTDGGKRVIVVITDGQPDDEQSAIYEATRAKKKGIHIITIGTQDANHEFLRKIASSEDLFIPVDEKKLSAGIQSSTKLLPLGE